MQNPDNAITRFSAAAHPPAQRSAMVREEIWRPMYGMDMVPARGDPLVFEFSLLSLPGLYFQNSYMSSARLIRDRALASSASDSLALVSYFDGPVQATSGRHQIHARPGEFILVRTTEPANFIVPRSRFVCIDVERSAIQPLLSSGQLPPLTVMTNNNALRMLLRYVTEIMGDAALHDAPELQRLAVQHVQELVALAIGNGSHVSQESRTMARLREARALVAEYLVDRNLSSAMIAGHLGITPRYLQKLFEQDGTTFSRYVLEQRLDRACRLLTNPAWRHCSITAIALESGFGDISYFNRRFRQIKGITPSELRKQYSHPITVNGGTRSG